MTLTLNIYFDSGNRATFSVPIATKDEFATKWAPLYKDLGLTWVPRFIEGVTIPSAGIETVLDELERIKSFVRNGTLPFNMHVDEVIYYADRLDNITMALQTIRNNPAARAEVVAL